MQALRVLLLIAAAVIGIAVLLMFTDRERNDSAPVVPTLHRAISSEPESLDLHKMRSTQAGEVLRDLGAQTK